MFGLFDNNTNALAMVLFFNLVNDLNTKKKHN